MAEGITVDRFSQILDSLMVESTTENRNVNLSVYPEHYVLTPDEYGVLEVIEKTGNAPIPVQFFITFGNENGLTEPKNVQFTHVSRSGKTRRWNGYGRRKTSIQKYICWNRM